MSHCMACNRPLTDPGSVVRGMGPICVAKMRKDLADRGQRDQCDLPWDPETMDVVCMRDPEGETHFNIFQTLRFHSPTGMEWGEQGPGPSDFALNIVELFTRAMGHSPKKRLRGNKVTWPTYSLYMRFRDEFVTGLDKQGGIIRGEAIFAWLKKCRVPDWRS